MTNAELRALLLDCLALWGVAARVDAADTGLRIIADTTTLRVEPAPADMRPVRWLLHRPNRPPRVAPSIGALLTALRNALGAESGNKVVIGSGRSPDFSRHGRTMSPGLDPGIDPAIRIGARA
ncbi:MAG TPA: hypothetical protein VL614_24920 [Acetobacteraceae bacterium]|nr:hypothetical protein [Acetobacteraceae bacterium]